MLEFFASPQGERLLRELLGAALPWATAMWGAARLLFPRRRSARLWLWGALCLAAALARAFAEGYFRRVTALWFRPWEVFPIQNGMGAAELAFYFVLCGFPFCLVLAALLDALREDLEEGRLSWRAPLFWFAATGAFTLGMLYGSRGERMLPELGDNAGFFVCALAFAREAAHLERERRRGRGSLCLPVMAALLLLLVSALLDSPAALFLLPFLPIRVCYAVALHGPGVREERLEEERADMERELHSLRERLRRTAAPRAQRETPGFWLLPDVPTSAVLEQLKRDGRIPEDES